MRKLQSFYLSLLTLIAVSCSTAKVINYSQISVPQEGGYQFKQITSEEQIYLGPQSH